MASIVAAALLMSTGAAADPGGTPAFRPLTGVGSGTTADVMNALGGTLTLNGQPVVGSFDATGSATIHPKDTCTIARPGTDAAGLTALRASMAAGDGCVDFARLSYVPEPTPDSVTYLPFARDTVTFLVSRTGSVPRLLDADRLRGIYTCQDTAYRPLLPPVGSRLRAIWLDFLSIAEGQVASCVSQVPRENDASALDGTSILPFSIAQYASQSAETVPSTVTNAAVGRITGATGGDGGAPLAVNRFGYDGDVSWATTSPDLPQRLTLVQLQRLYRCYNSTISGVTVRPLLPTGVSPVRDAWLTMMGIRDSDIANGDYPCIGFVGSSANDTRTLPGDGILPFSVTQFIQQSFGLATDMRGAATLGEIGTYPARPMYVGNPNYSPALVHDVYIAVPTAKLGATPWKETFVGENSLLCKDSYTIRLYGFTTLPNGACGGGTPDSQRHTGNGKLVGVGSASTAPVMGDMSSTIHIDNAEQLSSYWSSGSDAGLPCGIPRPADDAQGVSALLESRRRGDGCVDFARVSNRDPVASPSDPALVYAPYALDSVSFAVPAGGSAPRRMTRAQLQNVYRCGDAALTPMLPAAGSELRATWLRYLSITAAEAAGLSCLKSTDAAGRLVADNDGRVLTNTAIVPYSVANYLAQAGTTAPDLRGRAVLGTVTDPVGPAPIRPNDAAYPENVSFAVRGDVAFTRRLSLARLQAIYTCADPTVTPLLPVAGAVRTAFAAFLEIDEPLLTDGTYPCVRTTTGGSALAENDASGLTGVYVLPYSISAYVDQLLGTAPDRRGATVLGVLDQGGGPPSLPMALDPGYVPELTHRVYNALPEATINTSPLNEVFSGPNSLICQQPGVLLSHGLAPLTATDAEPCGSLQRPTATAPAAANSTMLRSMTPLDEGRVPGSGATAQARHGRCTLTGGFTNDSRGRSITVTATVTGPRCKVQIYAVFYQQSDGATVAPDQRQVEFVNGGTLSLTHTPGTWAYRLGGVSDLIGHQLQDATLRVSDISAGAPSGESSLGIYGEPVPDVFGLTVVSSASGASVTWNKKPEVASYRVYRRAVASQTDFSLLAVVQADPQQLWTESYFDRIAHELNEYAYRVAPMYLDAEGSRSAEVRTVPATPSRIKHYVAMGDSYASGEGGRNYVDGDGSKCHRSYGSYAALFKDPADSQGILSLTHAGKARLDLVACSGAVMRNIVPGLPGSAPLLDRQGKDIIPAEPGSEPQPKMEPWRSQVWGNDPSPSRVLSADYQVRMLSRTNANMPVDLVTLSIGGNDAGFSNVLKYCVYYVCDDYETVLLARIESMRPMLAATYQQVLDSSGDAQVQVIGYPALFPDSGPVNCALWNLPGWTPFVKLSPTEMTMLNRLGDRLNKVIRETVKDVGDVNGRIGYVDVRPLFSGHDICAGEPWLRQLLPTRIGLGMLQEGGHPNPTGWSQEAGYIPRQFLGTD
ncbi:hypothetical protein Lfu02_70060 [Longispora fulva]|uniref:ABC-type phosphate transport system substrate-binding protein n=1 Tax=Longispora fulva TaxID=619741 RepID=A0A8J7G7G4_9ACTN|nr:SGNH/GDSL hydrolase family protein [Longispora fulva]MBG6134450.1 ABC-type phosphate transport system substrate-binding protein [Longispora fulva]GIG62634.1 hypothetical protein Lfu02_70060 [Longispora fulva]